MTRFFQRVRSQIEETGKSNERSLIWISDYMETLESFALEFLVQQAVGHQITIFRWFDVATGEFAGYMARPVSYTAFGDVIEDIVRSPFKTPLEAAVRYVQIHKQWDRGQSKYWPDKVIPAYLHPTEA